MSHDGNAAGFRAVFRELPWYRTNVPCMEACPVHTDSGRYVQEIAAGDFLSAYFVARSANPLASICGRICAAPCEDACRRNGIDGAVMIRPLKRFVTERYGVESSAPDTFRGLLAGRVPAGGSGEDVGCSRPGHLSQLAAAPPVAGGKKVAVIGAGPAGLGCAHDLALLGHDVTVIESQAQAGGMLRYGIPEYRLPRGVIEREAAAIARLGVTFRYGTALDAEYNLKALRGEGFEAVFLSVGAARGRDLEIPGHELDGVVKAVDYLLNLNRGYRVDLGERVVVVGGGSVAFDAARSAVREFYQPMEEIEATAEAAAAQPLFDAARGALRSGASEVHVASLESLHEMPAALTVQGRDELREALEEGVELHPSWGPSEILGRDGKVTGIRFQTCTRVFDDEGRFNPRFDTDKIHEIAADSVILAVGQQADLSFLDADDGVELTRGGTVKIDPETLATTAPGLYAGGDVAFGPRIAIEAVAGGKRAARSIHDYLGGGGQAELSLQVDVERIPPESYRMPAGYEQCDRGLPPTLDVGRRTGITEVEEVFDEVAARRQAERCLQCHVDTIYDPEKCVLCGRCADVCPESCLTFVPIDEVDLPEAQRRSALEAYAHDPSLPLTVLLKDDTRCIRCGLCARRCPTEAMTMERFHFVESGVETHSRFTGVETTDE